MLGRTWQRQQDPSQDGRLGELLELLHDAPDRPLSIHSICDAGAAAGWVAPPWAGGGGVTGGGPQVARRCACVRRAAVFCTPRP